MIQRLGEGTDVFDTSSGRYCKLNNF